MQVAGSVFLVTGGGSGLGQATVRHLAVHGARVVIVDLDAPAGQSLVAELGEQARFVTADVAHAQAMQQAVTTAVEAFGALHGLINCAGTVLGCKVVNREGEPHPLESFARTVQVNLVGTFNAIRLAAKLMAQGPAGADGERGVIVNTASVAAYDGQIGQAAYSASKAGIVGMTLPLARELAAYGIRVVTIAPGVFATPMMASLPEQVRTTLGEQTPFPARLGHPSEFAALVQHVIEIRC
ncbi:SDR family NAD(P)-dependent oxidoreductase [Nitrococcus mobilis]|uniref:Probable short-chain dehydrogenase n=1 Tax=Nitrococcus mobilis Nb-231 TaxID=314278 RepID=A4BLG0_9GAMM|nr:SDR family NAD(P)-dependent oxidoreductase [Nitrococcus mobilis]EAR23148.1 probable short-chain dehydrogenase [Nitrococcus mobilis Nb-231]